VCTCLLFVVDCFHKKSVVAIISLKRKIGLATTVKKKCTFLTHHNIKTKVKIVTKKKIFDLDPGKLYFINKRVKLREKNTS
jgi:hypothetical protein